MANILKTAAKALFILLGTKIIEKLLSNRKRNSDRTGDRNAIDRPPSKYLPKKGNDCDRNITVDGFVSKYIPSQLVVWKKPGVSDTEFNEWKKEHLQNYPGLLVKKLCRNCDDSLELWEGDNVSTLISEKVAGSGTSTSKPPPQGGGDAIACFSYNLIIDLPEPVTCLPDRYNPDLKIPELPQLPDPPVIVAVFDTGLTPAIKAAYPTVAPSCLPNGNSGWNFAYKNDVTDDDYPSLHGSAVTGFIADQGVTYAKQKISILPVKVHNNYGKSDLFSILCGFAYAARCGAKIINASFGFYASKNAEAPAILAQFVKKHLTDNNILLIAAAGNVNQDESAGKLPIEDFRNLDYHPFFPACLSKTFENVLTVTTVSTTEGKVSPSQNFSRSMVDAGVDCDVVVNGDYRFEDPLGRNVAILGSSYATPIITGKIAQHYHALMSAMPLGIINKSILLDEMKKMGLIKSAPAFDGLIKDGNISKK